MSQNGTQENNLENNNQSQTPDLHHNNKQYPSGELLFSVIQKEYDYEAARKNALETRSGILLTLAAAIITFIFSNIKIPDIKTPIDEFSSLTFYVSYFLVAIIAISAILISFFYLLRVIFIAEYKRFEIDDITRETAEAEPDLVAFSLTDKYQEIINNNHSVNHDKAILYRRGKNFLIIAIFSRNFIYYIC